MADQLFLSYRLRGYTESNMLRHYEKMLRRFPFSKLSQTGSTLTVYGVSWDEPALFEGQFADPPDIDAVLAAAREFAAADCAVQLETWWDLWRYDKDWKVEPTRVALHCFGPAFESVEDDHLRIDFGVDAIFLPQPDVPESAKLVQSNIRSLLHLAEDLDSVLLVERKRLWTESGENFAEQVRWAVNELED